VPRSGAEAQYTLAVDDRYKYKFSDSKREPKNSRGPADRPPERPDIGNQDQVKRLKRGMERSAVEVIRCQKCGHQQQAQAAIIGPKSVCDKCATPLYSCRHCLHFMPTTRFECRKPIEAAIADKWAANSCPHFEPRLVLDATGRRVEGQAARNSKSLFDSLFKK
jgi:hypothetical protein